MFKQISLSFFIVISIGHTAVAQVLPTAPLKPVSVETSITPKVEPTKPAFTGKPYFHLDQPGRKLTVFDGVSNTYVFNAATASPGNRNKPGIYKFIQASAGLHHFTGWGNPVMVYNAIYFTPEKDSRSFEQFVKTGTFVSSMHTQPKSCAAGIPYLARRQSYVNKQIGFFKANDTLRTANPEGFNKAYMLFKSSNPEPQNPCPEAPLVPWGESHGCVRLGKVEAEYVMTLFNFLVKQGQKPALYVDVNPPSIPTKAVSVELK
jgi:hypothetical protein